MSTLETLKDVEVKDGHTLKCFSLSCNGVVVKLCSIGASITNLHVPNFKDVSKGADDIVLGYKSPAELYESKNGPYLCVVVGRVANRIAKGVLSIGGQTYELATNNAPNHLHGGDEGFNNKNWDADIVNVPASQSYPETKGVRFTLTSKHLDQGYPGTVEATATYTLLPKGDSGATLCLQMTGKLLDDETTPFALAQHSYFNLSRHNDPNGVLDHRLTMPSTGYTPVDSTLIPTREVISMDKDSSMDWRSGRVVRTALKDYGIAKANLQESDIDKHFGASRCLPDIAKAGTDSLNPGEPYGFDHNYVVNKDTVDETGLSLAGTVEHADTKRRMTVRTDAPGVQLYTANYLDGSGADIFKDSTAYPQWQALCLETQTFPDSVQVNEQETPDFAAGKCHVLSPGGPEYSHRVEYSFEPLT